MAEGCRKIKPDEIAVGLICAKWFEKAALLAMLDDRYEMTHDQDRLDNNSYTLGRIAKHKVVIACLPAGLTGTTSAATVAGQMNRSFKSIKIRLMVGIGGGVWSEKNDVRQGDVVVSQPGDRFGGVVQYDMGKRTPEGKFERTGSLDKPPLVLLSALEALRAEIGGSSLDLGKILHETFQKHPGLQDDYGRPDERDDLYEMEYQHDRTRVDCIQCDGKRLVKRTPRKSSTKPETHYGTIASGNSVIKCAVEREQLCKDLNKILCFEMEAAGLMHDFQCLVIRGISDYADSHKNNKWQKYAAISAAAYAKKLLTTISSRDVKQFMATQQMASPYGQSPPLSELTFAQQPSSYFDQFPLQSQYSSLQQRAEISERFPSGFGQQFAYQGAFPSDRSSPGLGQLSSQQSASHSKPFRPKLELMSAYSSPETNQASAETVSWSHLQPPPPLSRMGHSDTDLMRYGGNKRESKGIQRKAVGSQQGGGEGYRQAPKMVYAQPPRMSQPCPSHQPRQNYPGSPIPLRPLPATKPEPSRSITSHEHGRPAAVTYLPPTAVGATLGAAKSLETGLSGQGHSKASKPGHGSDHPPAAGGATLVAAKSLETGLSGQGHSKAPKPGHGSEKANQRDPDHGSAKPGDGGPDRRNAEANPGDDVILAPLSYSVIDDHSDASSTIDKDRDAPPENMESHGGAYSRSISEDSDKGNNNVEGNHWHDDGVNHHSSYREVGEIPLESRPDADGRNGEAADYYTGNVPWSYEEPRETSHRSTLDHPANSHEGSEQGYGANKDGSNQDISDTPYQTTANPSERGVPEDDGEQSNNWCCGGGSDDDDDNGGQGGNSWSCGLCGGSDDDETNGEEGGNGWCFGCCGDDADDDDKGDMGSDKDDDESCCVVM